MYYPDEIIDEVRSRSDIVDIISGYVNLKRAGNTYKGLCPFHNEKTPSFSVNPSGQFFHCFGCGKGGNVFTFVCEYENYTFPEAVKYLADKAGVALPEIEYDADAKQKRDRKTKLLEINKEAAKYFYYQLRIKPGEIAKKYFLDRKLTDETMQKFGLGYSLQYSDDLYKYLKGKNYSDELLEASGLFTFNEKYGFRDKFINRVMFPISDINHKVIAFGGRVMGQGEPKYLNSPETELFSKSNVLYGLDLARTSRRDRIIMCEGYMDVIAMHQAGFTEAAASLGTAFTTGHAMLLKRYTNNIYLAYDSDGAGTKAALKNIGILRSCGLGCRIINLEPYKDPDEFIKNLGTEEFENRINNAENAFMFRVRQARRNYTFEDPADLTNFQTAVADMLCEFSEELERDNYLDAVCRKYEINKDGMKKLVLGRSARMQPAAEPEETIHLRSGKKEKDPKAGEKKLQRYLLTYIIDNHSLYDKIKNLITPEDFTDDMYKKVAGMMFSQLEEKSLDPSGIISCFDDIEEQRLVAEIFNTKIEGLENDDDNSKAFRDVVIGVKENAFKHYEELSKTDARALQTVIEEKKKLEKLKQSGFSN